MEFESVSVNQLRTNDLFYDPEKKTLYEFRGNRKASQEIFIREFTSSKVKGQKISSNKTLLKVTGNFPQYQVLEFIDSAVSLFNTDSGDMFELSSVHLAEQVEEAKQAYDAGIEVNVEIFEYQEERLLFKFIFDRGLGEPGPEQTKNKAKTPSKQPSEDIPANIKEIEARKAKRRSFEADSKTSKSIQPNKIKTSSQKQAKIISKPAVKKISKKSDKITKEFPTATLSKTSTGTIIDPKPFKAMGSITFKSLHKLGITTLEELIAADASKLGSNLPRISTSRVEEWQKEAKKQLKT